MDLEYRYYLKTGDGDWREVTKEEFVRAERRSGFHNKFGHDDEPATGGFSVMKPGAPEVRGRVDLVR